MDRVDVLSGTEIMSITEAREFMPDTTKDMSDKEVLELVNRLTLLAGAFIEAVQFDDEFIVNIE